MANRLKRILPLVISQNQSAFVEGRLISDNILIAHEVSHFIRTHRGRGPGFISIKLDMSKAFDRVEWPFLEKMLISFGFRGRWVSRVMQIVRAVRYKVQVNQLLSDVIVPSRGLRQGDPISPYLFILCAEWLSRALEEKLTEGRIKGVKVNRRAVPVTHLFFADDSLIFLKADRAEVHCFMEVLRDYENLSGQRINLAKSELVCSRNVSEEFKLFVTEELGVKIVERHSKYLGLPLTVGQNKRETFKEIEDRVMKRTMDWKCKLLSGAGKLTLIQSTLQVIPNYAMQCYMLPVSTANRLRQIMLGFLWNKRDKAKGIHWVSKEIVFRDKQNGGLGIRNPEDMNKALLLKQVWRVVKHPDMLVAKILRARYYEGSSLLEAGQGRQSSHVWRSMLNVRHFLREGLAPGEREGDISWHSSPSGTYTTRSGYEIIAKRRLENIGGGGEQSDPSRMEGFWRKVWKVMLPPRIKLNAWRLFYNSLPDLVNLRKRGCLVGSGCVFCGLKEESALHIVRDCWLGVMVRNRLGVRWQDDADCSLGSTDWLVRGAEMLEWSQFRSLLCAIWFIWLCHNEVRFEGKGWRMEEVVRRVHAMLYQCDNYLGRRMGDRLPVEKMEGESSAELRFFCDSSWKARDRYSGWAVVGVEQGWVRLVKSGFRSREGSCYEAEGFALLQGMELASELHLTSVVFVSDSLEVVWAIFSGGSSRGIEGLWVARCLALLSQNSGWRVVHALREFNLLADHFCSRARNDRWEWSEMAAIPAAAGLDVASYLRTLDG